MRWANFKSFGIMVILFACMAHKLVSSNNPIRYFSAASCRAPIAGDWNRISDLNPWAISRTRRWNGIFLINRLVVLWYSLISLRALAPGRNRKRFNSFFRPIFFDIFLFFLGNIFGTLVARCRLGNKDFLAAILAILLALDRM